MSEQDDIMDKTEQFLSERPEKTQLQSVCDAMIKHGAEEISVIVKTDTRTPLRNRKLNLLVTGVSNNLAKITTNDIENVFWAGGIWEFAIGSEQSSSTTVVLYDGEYDDEGLREAYGRVQEEVTE